MEISYLYIPKKNTNKCLIRKPSTQQSRIFSMR